MKVVQITSIDTMMHNMMGALNKECINQDIEVIAICEVQNHGEEIKATGVKLINQKIGRKIHPIANLKTIYELVKLLKKEKPDIVHTHAPIASVLSRIACKISGVQCVVYTAHGFYFHDEMSKLQYSFFFRIEKIMAKYFTDYLFVQSKEDTDLSISKKFLSRNKISYIGNGVDIKNKFNPQRYSQEKKISIKKELGIHGEDTIISFIGRLVEEKGIIDLLKGFSKIKNKNLKLLIIGDVAPGERDLKTVKEIEEYKTNKNIIFTGRREDVNNLLMISDIFCLPSYREGLPRSIIEAMSMKNAIIATNIRGCREQVQDGVNGFLVPLNNPEIIADKINTLIDNPNLLNKFKESSLELARDYYDEEKIVKFQIEKFREIERNTL